MSQRCSVCHQSAESISRLCLRHSSTPIVPAPPGWSVHESMYSPEDSASLQRHRAASPARIMEVESQASSDGKPSPKFIMRQKTVGSGENYGFIYGSDEKDPSEHQTSSSGASSQRSGMAKPVKCPQVADSRFKTEAVIEVDQKRPFSIESTKSAPDVIATHWRRGAGEWEPYLWVLWTISTNHVKQTNTLSTSLIAVGDQIVGCIGDRWSLFLLHPGVYIFSELTQIVLLNFSRAENHIWIVTSLGSAFLVVY